MLDELQQKAQLRELLKGIEPSMLGVEELVLLLIWSKPLVYGPGGQQQYQKDQYAQQARAVLGVDGI